MRGVGGVTPKRKAEKTQQGNPHGLTIQQHVLPARSIDRFAGDDGCVSVFFKEGPKKGKTARLAPRNPLFCAERVWDQRSENIMKKVYEDPFQDLAERINSGETQSLGKQDNITATGFWGLWKARFLAKSNPPKDKQAVDCTGIESQELREIIEKNHGVVINPDGTLPGSALAGMEIQKLIDRVFMRFGNRVWSISEALESEFIVPDNPCLLYIPISCKICLQVDDQNLDGETFLTKENLTIINKSLSEVASRYIFANSFNQDFT